MRSITETYDQHVGLRLTPHMHNRLKKAASAHNLKTSVYARQLILNALDDLEGKKPKN